MKILMGQPLHTLDGEVIQRAATFDMKTAAHLVQHIMAAGWDVATAAKLQTTIDDALKGPLTLGVAAINALVTPTEGEKWDGAEQLRRVDLARRCNVKGRANLSNDEVELIRRSAEKFYTSPVVSVQIRTLLEGKEFALSAPDDDEAAPEAQ
jgi:hypothetical protein